MHSPERQVNVFLGQVNDYLGWSGGPLILFTCAGVPRKKSIPSRTKITKSPGCSSFYCPSCEFPPYQELFICQFSRGVGLLIHSFPGGRVCFSKRVVVPAQVGDDRS